MAQRPRLVNGSPTDIANPVFVGFPYLQIRVERLSRRSKPQFYDMTVGVTLLCLFWVQITTLRAVAN